MLGPLVGAAALAGLAAIVMLALLQAGGAAPSPSQLASPTSAIATPTPEPESPSPSASELPSPSPSPSPSASPSPTESPSPVPTPLPTATRLPTPPVTFPPTWSPAAVREQVSNLFTAIANAEASFSFTSPADSSNLRSLAQAIVTPLDALDQHATAIAVEAVRAALERIVLAGRLHNAQELQQTVSNLVDAAGHR